MANYTSTSGSYTTTLTVTQTSQNTANNTSTLTYSLTLTKNAGSGLWNNNSCPWSITIDGTQVASGTFTYDFRNYSSLTLKSSTTTTVNHNSDGTKTVSVSASVNMNNSDYVSVMQPSGSLTLTTIPRASDVTVSNYSITNTSGSISATITSKANFYHKWRYKVGSGSWSAWTNKGQINNTSSTVTVANTTLLAGMPTSTSTTFYIEVQTYSDSGYATLVGTKSASSTITVNTSNIKPSISLGNIAINSSPISGYAVAGYSSVKSTATTTNSSGASSFTNYFTVSTGSLVSSSSTTASTTVTTNTVPANASNYTLTIYAYAKDSRGAVSSTVSKTITVYGYQPPTATLNAYRVASSSATTEDGAGTYAYVTFSGAVSSSVNSQNTIQSTTCTYSGSISGTASNGGHYALSDTQSVTFTLTVTDKVTSSTVQKTINTATYPLDLYDNGSGSVGMGVGAVAQAGRIDTSLPLVSSNNVPLKFNSAYSADKVYNVVQVKDADTPSTNGAITAFGGTGGCTIIGAGESVNSRFNEMTTDTEWMNVTSDQGIYFFVGANTYANKKQITMDASGRLQIGYDGDASAEKNVQCWSGAGGISMFSVASDTGNRGIWAYAHGTGSAKAALVVDTNNEVTLNGTATYAYWTETNPSSITNYYIPFGGAYSTSAGRPMRSNNGLWYRTQEGTTSAMGFSILNLGNSTANGTAGNKTGALRIYATDNSYTEMRSQAGGAGYIAYLPKASSAHTYLQSATSLWTGSLTAGNTLSLATMANYSRIKVYAFSWGAQHIFEIDFSATPNAGIVDSGYPYQSGTVVPMYSGASASGTMEYHGLMCKVSSDKKTFYFCSAGYWSNSVSWTARQGNSQYYVYKIEGLY